MQFIIKSKFIFISSWHKVSGARWCCYGLFARKCWRHTVTDVNARALMMPNKLIFKLLPQVIPNDIFFFSKVTMTKPGERARNACIACCTTEAMLLLLFFSCSNSDWIAQILTNKLFSRSHCWGYKSTQIDTWDTRLKNVTISNKKKRNTHNYSATWFYFNDRNAWAPGGCRFGFRARQR